MIRSLRFLFERKKAIDHYTVYGGTLLIRNDADGKSYLYDLLDVEKKKVISKTSFSAETHSEVTSPKPSDTSILTDGENVKSQFSLKAYSEAEKKDHVKSAKEFFGKTYSWNETGYITTDGTKLDFFGRHDGAPGGQTGRRGDGSGHLPRQTPTISIHAPREGGRPQQMLTVRLGVAISIHVPREGGDHLVAAVASAVPISIHAPREGGDSKDAQFYLWIFDKQVELLRFLGIIRGGCLRNPEKDRRFLGKSLANLPAISGHLDFAGA